jgi:hypothetical protein
MQRLLQIARRNLDVRAFREYMASELNNGDGGFLVPPSFVEDMRRLLR